LTHPLLHNTAGKCGGFKKAWSGISVSVFGILAAWPAGAVGGCLAAVNQSQLQRPKQKSADLLARRQIIPPAVLCFARIIGMS
jgi:hypothetical protein